MMNESFGWFCAAEEFGGTPEIERVLSDSGSVDGEPSKQRILVVDDERRVADTLCVILGASGFDARAAYNGWTALDTAARFQPDYLLSDVLMPRMNGVELAITARNSIPLIKILLFSTQVGISEILESGQKRGFTFQLIAKPIHPLKLIEQLKML
ncbi:MAG TPA: response regulator [Terracidiphilus sp.]